MPKKNRFKVIEHFNGFEIMDRTTKKTAWLGDGVDAITTPTGKSVSPGTKNFAYRWERMFNENPEQTAEAYFPTQTLVQAARAFLTTIEEEMSEEERMDHMLDAHDPDQCTLCALRAALEREEGERS